METIQNKVFQALGQASMCWSVTPKGIFQSSLMKTIGDELMQDIQIELDRKQKEVEATVKEMGKCIEENNRLMNIAKDRQERISFLEKRISTLQSVAFKNLINEAIDLFDELRGAVPGRLTKEVAEKLSQLKSSLNENPVYSRNASSLEKADIPQKMTLEDHYTLFKKELSGLINKFGLDSHFCIPDFILAEIIFKSIPFLKECQASFDKAAILQKKPAVDKS